jgi:hypothetical protein
MLSFISFIYTNFINVFVLLSVTVGIYFLFKKPLYTFYIAILTLPFKGLYLWVGTNIEIWKILSALTLLFYGPMLMIRSYNQIKKNRFIHLLTFYILYVIMTTLLFLFFIPESDKHSVSGGFFKNEGRFLYQIGLFIITINLILWPIYVIKKEEDLSQIFKLIVYSNVVLASLGVVQELSIRIAGYDPFPINRPTGFDYEGGSLVVQGAETIHRMNSLAGEPKHLAIALIVGVIVIILYRLNGKKIINYDLLMLTMLLVCLVATYSTTGYIWFGVVMVIIAGLYRFKISKNIILLLVAAGITMGVMYYSTEGNPAPYIVKTINKAGLEVQDEAVFDFFKSEPLYTITGFGLGNIHFYAEAFLPPGFPLFRDAPFKGNTGFFFLLGDVGITGIIMLTFFVVGLVRSNSRFSASENGEEAIIHRIFIHFAIIASVMFLFRYFEFFFVALGIMLYLNNNYRLAKTRYPQGSLSEK